MRCATPWPQAGAQAADVKRVVHATTLATNLILERKGARLGFVTTRGFGDMFHISKQYPSGIDRFNALYERPEPLVERDCVIEINGRLNAHGEVLTPLDEPRRAIKYLAAKKPAAIAVCLIHSYANPTHERKIAQMLQRQLPGLRGAVLRGLARFRIRARFDHADLRICRSDAGRLSGPARTGNA